MADAEGSRDCQDHQRARRRLILRNFVSLAECKELEFIHKSSSTVGYRPNVFSTTLSHLIATDSPHFLVPFVPIRERLKDMVEEFFCCEYELVVEFTGLISWTRGASIGWHSDDNRPYLKQRDFTAVCYLNSHGKDFEGGLLQFQDGEPTTVVPMAGDVTIYTADTCNIHSVDKITEGERLTLTMWFSRDSVHDEDAKLISLLSEKLLHSPKTLLNVNLPMLASSNMYWFSPDPASHPESGFDICCARMHVLGFDIYCSQGKIISADFAELLMGPLQVAKGNELFDLDFVNTLHALQVVQFYCWKASEFQNSQLQIGSVVQLSQSQRESISAVKSTFMTNHQLAETVFGHMTCDENRQHSFDWNTFSAAVAAFGDYTREDQLKWSLWHIGDVKASTIATPTCRANEVSIGMWVRHIIGQCNGQLWCPYFNRLSYILWPSFSSQQ